MHGTNGCEAMKEGQISKQMIELTRSITDLEMEFENLTKRLDKVLSPAIPKMNKESSEQRQALVGLAESICEKVILINNLKHRLSDLISRIEL